MATVTQLGELGNQVLLAAGQTASQTVVLTGLHSVGNNDCADSLVVAINISAFTSGTLTVTVSGLTASAYTYTILASAALGSAAATVLQMAPYLTAATNLAASAIVPGSVQIAAVVSGGGSLTYGVDYFLGF